jgi:small GTP-binding protein
MNNEYDYIFKVIIIGDHNCGKTSLVGRFTGVDRPMEQQATIGVDFTAKYYTNSRGKRIKLYLWDTAGQEAFRSVVQLYYKNLAGAVLVFDVTSPKTFHSLDYWLKELQTNDDNDTPVPMLLLANKIDKTEQRLVGRKEAETFARDNGMLYEEVSVLNNINTDAALSRLFEKIYDEFIDKDKRCTGIKAKLIPVKQKSPLSRSCRLF